MVIFQKIDFFFAIFWIASNMFKNIFIIILLNGFNFHVTIYVLVFF